MPYYNNDHVQCRLTTQFEENPHHKLKVKISGDGAKMTMNTSFVIMSFSLLDCDDVTSSKGNIF